MGASKDKTKTAGDRAGGLVLRLLYVRLMVG
jgi:hypothetical protein